VVDQTFRQTDISTLTFESTEHKGKAAIAEKLGVSCLFLSQI
jgi:hypothetical protein